MKHIKALSMEKRHISTLKIVRSLLQYKKEETLSVGDGLILRYIPDPKCSERRDMHAISWEAGN